MGGRDRVERGLPLESSSRAGARAPARVADERIPGDKDRGAAVLFHPLPPPVTRPGDTPGQAQYPGFRRGSPGHQVMDSMPLRPDCRRFVCDLCGLVAYICSWCDRGHRYCSSRCRRRARRRSLRAAGRRYQQSRRGRFLHARRQAAYRRRRQASEKKVTHHSCRAPQGSASVSSCGTTRHEFPSPSPSPQGAPRRCSGGRDGASQYLLCCVCGHPCEPFVRPDFLRCRRPRGPRAAMREVGDDLPESGGRDPTPVHGRGLA